MMNGHANVSSAKLTVFLYIILVTSGNSYNFKLRKTKTYDCSRLQAFVSYDERDKTGLRPAAEGNIIIGSHIGFRSKTRQSGRRKFLKKRTCYYSNASSCVTFQILHDTTVKQIVE